MDLTAVYMALGGAAGALAKAVFTSDQETMASTFKPSKATVRDVLLGGVMGFLWNLYPVITLPTGASVAQQAVLVAVVGYLGADFLPNITKQVRDLKK